MSKKNGKASQSITWTNIRVRLGELKPWADNPRMSSKKQAQRLLDSWQEFGQVQTVAVDPDMNVLDGHQRLSALLTVYGEDYEIDARQSSRVLTDDERRKLVLALHAGAVGAWDWDVLSNWDESLLLTTFNNDLLRELERDEAAVTMMLKSTIAPDELWQGMPEFIQDDLSGIKVVVHFLSEDDISKFAEVIGQSIGRHRSIWYPYRENVKYGVIKDES